MTDLQKYDALCRLLKKVGETRVLAELPTGCGWDEHDVTKMFVDDCGVIRYCTPSWTNCHLDRDRDKHVYSAAYLYDQVFDKLQKRDRNLF